jgi:hypothetical protein
MDGRGDFLAEPAPEVSLGEPSTSLMEEKRRFERSRLDDGFGA